MTAFSHTYDTTTPDGASQKVPILDNSIRELKSAIQERENVDHVWPLTGTAVSDSDAGKHRRVVFYGVLSVKPTLEAGEGAIYIKTASGVSELFYEDSAGTEKQLTTAGKLNIAASDIADNLITSAHIQLANNSHLVGLNAAGNADVNLIRANASDKPELPDGAVMATSAAPSVDAGIANKKYVDDQVAATVQASGTTVFNGTVSGASTWQDLDLSAQVGATVAMVYLEVTASGGNYVAAKPKGYGSATFADHYSSGPLGASMTTVGSGKYSYLVCMTNSSGVIQIGSQYATAFTMKLIGFVK